MKQINRSWKGLLVALLVTSGILLSCTKDAKEPSLTSAAGKGGGGTAPSAAFLLHIPTNGTSCAGSDFCFDASFTNNGGNEPGGVNNSITVTVFDALNVQVGTSIQKLTTNDNFCISGLVEGSYSVRVTYSHTPSENSIPTQGTYSFPLTVQNTENCGVTTCATTGLLLSREASTIAVDANFNAVNVSVHYIVSNCSETDYIGLKLQGGLVNKAKTITNSNGGDATNVSSSSKTTNGNTTLTWIFDLAAGKSHTFNVDYYVWPTTCGNPLTGQWSLKKNSTVIGDVSDPGTNGYLSRLYWFCN